MLKRPKTWTFDPAVRELKGLVGLPALDKCPKEIKDGLNKALELTEMRDRFCVEVSSKSKMLQQVQQFTRTNDWEKAHEEGKTQECFSPIMMSGTLGCQFLKMLVSLQKPRRVLELGMYTGCGAVAMAEALPADGTLVTIDREPYLREVTQQFYDSFPQGKRIQVKIGEMKEILRGFLAEGQQFDLIFIDADKASYVDYYKIAMDEGLLAPGGTIVADNALWSGASYARPKGDLQANPLGVFIDHVNSDPRVESVLVPLDDGVMLIRRKKDIME